MHTWISGILIIRLSSFVSYSIFSPFLPFLFLSILISFSRLAIFLSSTKWQEMVTDSSSSIPGGNRLSLTLLVDFRFLWKDWVVQLKSSAHSDFITLCVCVCVCGEGRRSRMRRDHTVVETTVVSMTTQWAEELRDKIQKRGGGYSEAVGQMKQS